MLPSSRCGGDCAPPLLGCRLVLLNTVWPSVSSSRTARRRASRFPGDGERAVNHCIPKKAGDARAAPSTGKFQRAISRRTRRRHRTAPQTGAQQLEIEGCSSRRDPRWLQFRRRQFPRRGGPRRRSGGAGSPRKGHVVTITQASNFAPARTSSGATSMLHASAAAAADVLIDRMPQRQRQHPRGKRRPGCVSRFSRLAVMSRRSVRQRRRRHCAACA